MKHDENTFTCEKHETDEGRLQYTYKIGIEAFYEQAVYVIEENRKLHARLAEGEDGGAMHAGAALVLEDTLKNLELIKARFLDEKTK